MKVFAALLLVVAVAAAADYYQKPYKPVEYPETYPAASYDFDWRSTAENPDTQYGQDEARKGDDTKGNFFSTNDVTNSKVVYTVNGDSGFVAQSQFEIKGDSYGKPYYEKPKY